MKVCLVDDQRVVVDSLKNGIQWERLQVETVYTACSAREAKLILRNFPVDILLTDIEMPEEDGISLWRWAKKELPELECIFLTSHADFAYAREAIQLGSFDYILQPVRFSEVEDALLRVQKRLLEKNQVRRLLDETRLIKKQQNHILDAMLAKLLMKNWVDARETYESLRIACEGENRKLYLYPVLIQIMHWRRLTEHWDKQLVSLVFQNVAEELFHERKAKAWVSSFQEDSYWIFLETDAPLEAEAWETGLQEFYDFIDRHMDFSIAVYPAAGAPEGDFQEFFEELLNRPEKNTEEKKGILWENRSDSDAGSAEDPVGQAIAYIKRNLSKNISRTEVAEYVHLNEEYFSRLFRRQTGATFKDFILKEKMTEAMRLLKNSRLSVSIVASKVGYDNFSHFSKMFKRVTDMTPQEYRKAHEKS